ncbi:MAG: Flp family type IVb pilin [Henriciella sp.]|nr:Flp family type IVb pilin [Henriciella sp.]
MMAIRKRISALKKSKAGATAVEYALIMSLMVVALLGALSATSDSNSAQWNMVADEVDAVSPG